MAINLANGDFAAGESLTGGADTDNITLTNATTVNFTTGTLATIETLNGSVDIDNVTMTGAQLNGLTTLSFNGGADTLFITTTSTGLNALGNGALTGLETVSAATAAAGVTIDMTNQAEALTIIGSASNDTLTGGGGADIVEGGAGDDILLGGDSDDELYGDIGADTFIFDSNSIDTVTDFSEAQGDILDISDIVSGTVAVNDIDDFLQLNVSGSDTNVLVDRNGTNGGANFVQVGVLENVTGLNAQTLFDNGQVIEGGKVLCGHYFSRGMLSIEIYEGDLAFAASQFNEATRRGYRLWAVPLTAYLNKNPGGWVEKFVKPFVVSWATEMAYRAGVIKRGNLFGRALLLFVEPVVQFVGRFSGETDCAHLTSEKMAKQIRCLSG
ncbi:MAG: calcium-binding protein [Alphaproteobacteria bacterium]